MTNEVKTGIKMFFVGTAFGSFVLAVVYALLR